MAGFHEPVVRCVAGGGMTRQRALLRRSGLVAALVAVSACADTTSRAERESVEGARAAIAALHRRDMDASRRGDADALIALWSDHPIAISPQGPVLRGREALAANLRSMLGDGEWETLSYTQRFEEVEVRGDFAWDLGVFYGRSRNRTDGREVESQGKMLRILVRVSDGSWRVHRSMWIVDPPAQSAGAPE